MAILMSSVLVYALYALVDLRAQYLGRAPSDARGETLFAPASKVFFAALFLGPLGLTDEEDVEEEITLFFVLRACGEGELSDEEGDLLGTLYDRGELL